MCIRDRYKTLCGHPRLSAAEYRLTHTASNGRGVYTFCMCPGGSVVPSTSMEGGVVVNGMSEHARDRENANSALLVQIRPEDYGEHALDGIAYQEALEKKAFVLGGGAVSYTHLDVYKRQAWIAARALGLDEEEIAQGFASVEKTGLRNELVRVNQCLILNDSYKSNPQSALAAVDTMEEFDIPYKLAVLGDMLELGETSDMIHYTLGKDISLSLIHI